MKIYTTITSERNTKPKTASANSEQSITIHDQHRKEVGRLVSKYEGDILEVTYYPIYENCKEQKINSGRVKLYKTK